jgi:hypothetical protein
MDTALSLLISVGIRKAAFGRFFCCVPSMNDSLEVEVLYPA